MTDRMKKLIKAAKIVARRYKVVKNSDQKDNRKTKSPSKNVKKGQSC